MNKIFKVAAMLSMLILSFSACSNSSDSPDLSQDTEKIMELDNTFGDTQKIANEISARDIRRGSAPFSINDPFHGHRTNQIPLFKTDLRVLLNNDGTVTVYQERVQYGWSQQGVIIDSVSYKDEFKGKWAKTERLTSSKQTVIQIKLDNCGYVWYWPENTNKIYARPGDNWEDMINDKVDKAYDVIKH